MHGVELNSVRGSEFCETLTGGFTCKNSHSQEGGTLSKGELSVRESQDSAGVLVPIPLVQTKLPENKHCEASQPFIPRPFIYI